MKRIAIRTLIICFAIGLAVGIYDLFNPIILDDGEWMNPNSYTSSGEYWSDMIIDAVSWVFCVAAISYVPVFLLLMLYDQIKPKKKSHRRRHKNKS